MSKCYDKIEASWDECAETRDDGYRRCAQSREERSRECAERRDQGREECTAREDQRRERCARRQDQGFERCAETGTRRRRECSGWSWLICMAWSYVTETFCVSREWVSNVVCVAWEWVSNVVCVAWEWVSNVVCVAWTEIVNVVCVAWEWFEHKVCVAWETVTATLCFVADVVSTVVGTVLEIFESTIGFVLDMAALILLQLLRFPYVGRGVEIIWTFITEGLWRLVGGFVELIMWGLGVLPEKKVRICTVLPAELADDLDAAIDQLQTLVDNWHQEANVRVIPVNRDEHNFTIQTPFHATPRVDASWIRVIPVEDHLLRDVTDDEVDAVADDFAGRSGFATMIPLCIRGNVRKIIGYGPTVLVVFVRNHRDGSAGFSLAAFFNDFMTVNHPTSVAAPNADTTAHELGHKGSLTHRDAPSNLLHSPNASPTNASRDTPPPLNGLTRWQVTVARSSRVVTYF